MKDPENLGLLVSILNKYMYFFLSNRSLVPEADIKKLVDLINENIETIKGTGKLEKAKKAIKFFENTISALEVSEINIH
jgi:predicted RNA-binding protein with EMAP domain